MPAANGRLPNLHRLQARHSLRLALRLAVPVPKRAARVPALPSEREEWKEADKEV